MLSIEDPNPKSLSLSYIHSLSLLDYLITLLYCNTEHALWSALYSNHGNEGCISGLAWNTTERWNCYLNSADFSSVTVSPAAYCVSLTPFTVTAKHSSPETRSRGATNLICAARGPGDVGQGKVQYWHRPFHSFTVLHLPPPRVHSFATHKPGQQTESGSWAQTPHILSKNRKETLITKYSH